SEPIPPIPPTPPAPPTLLSLSDARTVHMRGTSCIGMTPTQAQRRSPHTPWEHVRRGQHHTQTRRATLLMMNQHINQGHQRPSTSSPAGAASKDPGGYLLSPQGPP